MVRLIEVVGGLFILALISGCGDGSSNSVTPGSATSGTVVGQVVSLATRAAVSGATVKTNAGSATTTTDGKFSVTAPAGDRIIVQVEASGFAEAFPVARVLSGQTTTLGVKLVPIGATETVSVAAGGTVSVLNSPARVVIPSNSLVPVDGGTPAGSVNVSVTAINPAEEPSVMPGGFNGVSSGGGSVQPLESGGAMRVDIRDSAGTRYDLAQGSTATIRIPLATQSPNPPATMPLWYFDETEGVWREEGTATLQGTGANRFYEGTVARVVYWNADLVLESIVVNGCVKDANGQPVANAWVQTEGIDYTGVAYDSTAADGTFSVAMRRNSRAKLGLFEFDRQTFNLVPVSNTVNVGPSATDINLSDCLVKQPGLLAITTTALPRGSVGISYNQTLAASGGVPGYVWSLNAGSNPLPNGLTLNPAGVISGTPGTAETKTITLKVADSTGGSTTKRFTLEIVGVAPPPLPPPVSPALAITTTSLPSGTVGVAYNQTLAASGGVPGYVWSLNTGSNPLPDGLALNPSGVVIGTPTAAGTTTLTVKVVDSAGGAATKEFNLTVTAPNDEPLVIRRRVLPDGAVGTAYNTTLAAIGGTGAKSWSVISGTLPDGLSLDTSTGVISGTPTTARSFFFRAQVQDSATPPQSDTSLFSIKINNLSGGGTGGGGGTLTVTGAPASVGGTFVVDARFTSTGVGNGVFAIVWGEISDPTPAKFHAESLTVGDSTNANGQILTASFAVGDRTNSFGWTCVAGFAQQCNGLTISRTSGAATFSNVVLTDSNNNTPPITLNGTLTFTPF